MPKQRKINKGKVIDMGYGIRFLEWCVDMTEEQKKLLNKDELKRVEETKELLKKRDHCKEDSG